MSMNKKQPDSCGDGNPAPFREFPDLSLLAAALRRASGFGLYIAECSSFPLRNRLTEALRDEVKRPIVVANMAETAIDDILPEISDTEYIAPEDAAVFIFGLDILLTDPARASQLASELNWKRNTLQQLKRPVVLWLSEAAHDYLAKNALDLYDWYSGVYYFKEEVWEFFNEDFLFHGVNGAPSDVVNAPTQEKKELIIQLEKQLTINEGVFGQRSPRLFSILSDLAALHYSIGNFSKGHEFFKRAISIGQMVQQVYFPRELDKKLLKILFGDEILNDPSDVEEMLQEVINRLGPEHIYTALARQKYAIMKIRKGEFGSSENEFRRSLETMRRVLGYAHPDVAKATDNYASLLEQTDRDREAVTLREEAAAVRRRHMEINSTPDELQPSQK